MKAVDLVPLRAAVLCANCEQIGAQVVAGRCIACGSSAVLVLSRILGSMETDSGDVPMLNEAQFRGTPTSWPDEPRRVSARLANAQPVCA